jgi:hypothetical protein
MAEHMRYKNERDPADLEIPELDEVVVRGTKDSAEHSPPGYHAHQASEPAAHYEALRAAVVAELLASLDALTRSAAEHALKAAAPAIFERLRTELRAHLAQRLRAFAGSQSDEGPTPP